MAREGEQLLAFTIPIFEPLPSQVRLYSGLSLQCELRGTFHV